MDSLVLDFVGFFKCNLIVFTGSPTESCVERKQGEVKWQRPKARCPGSPSEPRSLCFPANSHQSVLRTGRLRQRPGTPGHQEWARRPGTAGRGPHGNYGNRWGSDFRSCSGTEPEPPKRGRCAPSLQEAEGTQLRPPGAGCRLPQASTIQATTESVSAPCSVDAHRGQASGEIHGPHRQDHLLLPPSPER